MTNYIKKKYLIIEICLILAVALILGATTFSFAKFVKNSDSSSHVVVASAIINVGNLSQNEGITTYNFEIEDINPTTVTQIYNFQISNTKNSEVSDTAIKYELSISTTGYMPLVVNLKDENSNILAALSPTVHTSSALNFYNLSAGVESNDNYTLEVTWSTQTQYKDHSYQGFIDLLTISVNWEQVD